MLNETWKCPGCGTENEAENNFCGECGTRKPESLLWDCPNCGKKGIDSVFCPDCGTKFEAKTVEKTTAAADNGQSECEAFDSAKREGTLEAWQNFVERFPGGTLAAKAQNEIGNFYYKGYKVAQNYAEAAKWYKKAAEQGNAEAQNSIGYMYCFGQGVPQNYWKAVEWYQKAVDQENSDGEFNLAYCYHNGFGVEADDVFAKFLLEQAFEHGNMEAVQTLKEWYGGLFKKIFN